jgi:hypothetical protein
VSAIPVLNHGQDNKIDLKDGFFMYYDNVNMEFNIPPVNTKNQFLSGYKTLFSRAQQKLGSRYEIACISSHTYDEKECDHDDARVAGCNPEFSAWEVEVVTPPQFEGGFRSLGFHQHIGRSDYKQYLDDADGVPLIDPYSKIDAIKLMDIFVGIPLIVIDKDPTSVARKSLYGRAGSHRPTEFGVEYRAPGNYALRSPVLTELVFDLNSYVLELVLSGQTESVLEKYDPEVVQSIINNNEIDNGWRFIEKLDLPSALKSRVKAADDLKTKDFNVEWNVG